MPKAANRKPPYIDETFVDPLARGFAERVVRWARECNAPESTLDALRVAAYMTSVATTAGHVCIHIDDIAVASANLGLFLRDDLLASTMVGTPAAPGSLPLILDDQGRLYLHRYFDYERRLARRLSLQRRHPPATVDTSTRQLLDTLFTSTRSSATPDWQKLAGALVSPWSAVGGNWGSRRTSN